MIQLLLKAHSTLMSRQGNFNADNCLVGPSHCRCDQTARKTLIETNTCLSERADHNRSSKGLLYETMGDH